MSDSTDTDLLRSINTRLGALVALHTHRLLLEDPDLPTPRKRKIDEILADAGLSRIEIAHVLGKTPQAVGQILKGKEKKQ